MVNYLVHQASQKRRTHLARERKKPRFRWALTIMRIRKKIRLRINSSFFAFMSNKKEKE